MIRKIFLSLVVVYSLIMLTGCPSKKNLEGAFNASSRIGNLAEVAAVTTGDFYAQGFLTLEMKDRFAAGLAVILRNGKSVHQLLVAIKDKYNGKLNDVPKSVLADLDLIFSREVIAPFLGLLTQAGVLPDETAKQILLAFTLLKTAILTVSNIFGSGSASYEFYLHHREDYANAAAG